MFPIGLLAFFLKERTALRSASTTLGEAVSSDLATTKRQTSISVAVQGSTPFLEQKLTNLVQDLPYTPLVEEAYEFAAI